MLFIFTLVTNISAYLDAKVLRFSITFFIILGVLDVGRERVTQKAA
jgi:hypothetical protein